MVHTPLIQDSAGFGGLGRIVAHVLIYWTFAGTTYKQKIM